MAARRLVFGLLLVIGACSDKTQQPPPNNPQPDAAPGPGPNPTVSIHLGTTEAEALSTTPQASSYDVLQLSDLWFAYMIPAIPDVAVMHIQTLMPDGNLFTTYVAAYSQDPAAHPTVIPMGYTQPVDVRAAHKGDGTSIVLTYGIPISGTDYVRHAIAGNWKVRVSLESVQSSEIEGTVTFRVGP